MNSIEHTHIDLFIDGSAQLLLYSISRENYNSSSFKVFRLFIAKKTKIFQFNCQSNAYRCLFNGLFFVCNIKCHATNIELHTQKKTIVRKKRVKITHKRIRTNVVEMKTHVYQVSNIIEYHATRQPSF